MAIRGRDHFPGYQVLATTEVFERPLRLGSAPQKLSAGDVYLAERLSILPESYGGRWRRLSCAHNRFAAANRVGATTAR